MRDEMLKKLDALIEVLAPWGSGPLNEKALRAAWALRRAELAAERCENCGYWRRVHEACRKTPTRMGRCSHLFLTLEVTGRKLGTGEYINAPFDFCCPRFVPKPEEA